MNQSRQTIDAHRRDRSRVVVVARAPFDPSCRSSLASFASRDQSTYGCERRFAFCYDNASVTDAIMSGPCAIARARDARTTPTTARGRIARVHRRGARVVARRSARARAADDDGEASSSTSSTPHDAAASGARDDARRARARDLFTKVSKGAMTHGDDDGGGASVGKVLYKLQRARDAEAAEDAWALLNRVRADGGAVALTTKEWNFALSAVGYSKADVRAGRVLEIWERMCDAKARPNRVTMSALARGLCRGHADVRSTLARLRQGVMLGGDMDAYVLNILLLACVRDAKALRDKRGRRGGEKDGIDERAIVDAALEVWTVGQSYHNAYTLTSVMQVLRGCGQVGKALEIFDSVVWEECDAAKRVAIDASALAIGLSCCAEVNDAKSANKMYNRAKNENLLEELSTPDVNVVLTACSREGNVSLATQLFDAMLEGREPRPDKASLTAVILTCGRAGKGAIAMEYFKRGRAAGIDCDTIMINTLLDACAKSTHTDGLGVFMDAIEKQVPIDASTITFLLASFTESAAQPGQLQSAIEVMNMGEFLNLEPSTATLNALLRICVAADDLDRGRVEFIKARERGIPASSTSVAILAQAYAVRGAVKEAMELIRTGAALGVELNAGIFIQCVSACKALADGQGALMFYKAARDEYSIPPVTRLINELFDALARGGMWQDALRVLSDDVLDNVGIGERLADEDTVARLVRAFIVGGEVDQAAAALELGKFLTNAPCDRASIALRNAKRVATAKPA